MELCYNASLEQYASYKTVIDESREEIAFLRTIFSMLSLVAKYLFTYRESF